METVWPGRVVEENNLTVQISTLRRILDQARAEGSCIQTVLGHGYRFVAAVTRVAAEALAGAAPSAADQLSAFPDRPSLAVLPFQNISGDPEQQYFADGLVEETLTALSRIKWLFVIARNSSFAYNGQAVDMKQVGRELDVRYILEGSLRKAGQRMRIVAQLIDAATGARIWADRFDGSLDAVFELQDQAATGIASAIESTLRSVQTHRSADLPGPEAGSDARPHGAISAERRQLTVMSCHLAEATALASRLDPEDWRDLIAAYHSTVAQIVTSLDGFAAKHSGDGVLIYFGYPLAH